MTKIVLSALTLMGLIVALFGATTSRPASALPMIQPQTAGTVAYWRHHHYRHHYHHHSSGINIHL